MRSSPRTKRLAGLEWYRNLHSNDHQHRLMSLTWCDHLCLLSINTISVAYGDIRNAPCCQMSNEEVELPSSWRFSR